MAALNAFANDGSFLEQFLQGAISEVRPGSSEPAAEQPVNQTTASHTFVLESARDEAPSREGAADEGADNEFKGGSEEIPASEEHKNQAFPKDEKKEEVAPLQAGEGKLKAAVKVPANKPLIIRPKVPGGTGGAPSSKRSRKDEQASSLSAAYLDQMRKYAATSCTSGVDHARPLLK